MGFGDRIKNFGKSAFGGLGEGLVNLGGDVAGWFTGSDVEDALRKAGKFPAEYDPLRDYMLRSTLNRMQNPELFRWGQTGKTVGRHYSDLMREGGGFGESLKPWWESMQDEYGDHYQYQDIYTPGMESRYGEMQGMLRGEPEDLASSMAEYYTPYSTDFEGYAEGLTGGLSERYGQPYEASDIYGPEAQGRYHCRPRW